MGKNITLEEVENLIRINRTNLEVELEQQPDIYMRVADMSVEKISVRDFLKEEKDRVWAEQFLKAKLNYSEGKPPSDKVAETMADASSEFVEVTRKFLEAKKEAEVWWSKRESFQARTDCLKELSRIKSSGLYSQTEVRGKMASEEEYKKIKSKMREEE